MNVEKLILFAIPNNLKLTSVRILLIELLNNDKNYIFLSFSLGLRFAASFLAFRSLK